MQHGVGLVFNDNDGDHALLDGSGRARDHTERPERTQAVMSKLEKSGLAAKCTRIPVREATRPECLRCHTAEHCDALDALEHAAPRQMGGWFGSIAAAKRPLGASSHGWLRSGGDMYHNAATPKAARLAAGGVLALTEQVCKGKLRSGFAVVRPPGHHACTDRMCGFCFLNNAAIAAKAAVEDHGLSRVMLLDWDVHHGNGSQQIFEDDPRVLYLSLHKLTAQFFPGTGEAAEVGVGDGTGYNVNIPWRHEGMGDAEYAAAFDALVMPIASQFAPELLIVSAGFDAAAGDKVGGMALTADGFAAMAARLTALASGRAVYVLEGGYKPTMVAKCVSACVRTLVSDAAGSMHPSKAPAAVGPSPPGSPARRCTDEGVGSSARALGSPTRPKLARGAVYALSEAFRLHAVHWPVLHESFAKLALRSPRPSRTSDASDATGSPHTSQPASPYVSGAAREVEELSPLPPLAAPVAARAAVESPQGASATVAEALKTAATSTFAYLVGGVRGTGAAQTETPGQASEASTATTAAAGLCVLSAAPFNGSASTTRSEWRWATTRASPR